MKSYKKGYILALPFLLMVVTCLECLSLTAYAIAPPDEVVEAYIRAKQIQAIEKVPDVIDNIEEWSTSGERHEFYLGNDSEGVSDKLSSDYTDFHLDDWLGCQKWKLEGLCYKCDSLYDCNIREYKSYYYPVQTFEITRHVLASEYIPKFVIEALGRLVDYWYDKARDGAVDEIKRVADRINASSGSVKKSNIDLKQLDENFRERNDWVAANSVLEWRVGSTLAQIARIYPILGGACHTKSNIPIPYYSESPYLIDLTRLHDLWDIIFFIEQWLLELKFNKDLPNYGVGVNLLLGLSPLKPLKKVFALIPNLTVATPLLGPDFGGNKLESTEYSKGWLSSMLRAANFNRILPGIFSFIKYDESDGRKESRYQWLYPEYMVKDHGGCDKTISDYYGSYVDTDFHPEIDEKFEGRAIITQWQWFRCCPSGYEILVGDRPEYKD